MNTIAAKCKCKKMEELLTPEKNSKSETVARQLGRVGVKLRRKTILFVFLDLICSSFLK